MIEIILGEFAMCKIRILHRNKKFSLIKAYWWIDQFSGTLL